MSETTARMEAGDNPGDFTVDQVNDYLQRTEGAGSEEHTRVLAAEREGQARKGILGDDATPQPGETSTRGGTFQEVTADAPEPDPRGYLGTSPEAERTGRRDKGLSQRNPAILSGGPVPDSSPNVDDSEAIEALRGIPED